MHIFSFLFEILITYIEGFVLLLFLNAVFTDESRENNVVLTAVCAVLYTIVITVVNCFSLVSFAGVILMTIMLSAETMLLHKCKFFSALTASAVVVSIQGLFEMLVICIVGIVCKDPDFVFKIITNSNAARFAYILFIKISVILIYIVSRKRLNELNADIFDSGILRLTAAAAFFLNIKLSDSLIANTTFELKMGLSMMFVGFIAVIILVVIIMQELAEKKVHEKEYYFAEMKNSLLEQNLQNIHSLYNEKSKKIHDFNNHINVIKTLTNAGQIDRLNKYIDEIGTTPAFNHIFVTENEIINIIMNIKINDIENKNIKFDYKINIGKDIGIADSDLCSVLVNVLDNAVEAVEKENEKIISLLIDERGDLVYISAENYCSKNPIPDNFLSHKAGSHGWGTKIIADTVKKYNGYVDYKFNENKLKITIMMVKNQ